MGSITGRCIRRYPLSDYLLCRGLNDFGKTRKAAQIVFPNTVRANFAHKRFAIEHMGNVVCEKKFKNTQQQMFICIVNSSIILIVLDVTIENKSYEDFNGKREEMENGSKILWHN